MSAKLVETSPASGTGVFIPLNKLKKSPKNARKTPHSEAAIEAYAASIAAKGILQNLVVEPELDGEGAATGFYFVTIGEGRRLAQLLRVKRKEIKKTEPIRCIVDTDNDPHEISLDENVTRENMHPADQFEAFKKLADERGFGAEEIAARFGVTPHVVRQRLRLGAVSPKLMQLYRDGELNLDQLMAFAITADHTRQEGIFDRLSYNRDASTIRRLLTEIHVPATDRRARFVGIETYTEAGGTVLRDLFTEDRGGYLEDVALLDRLVTAKLAREADSLREAEGWKWTEAHLEPARGQDSQKMRARKQQDVTRRAASASHDAIGTVTDLTRRFSPRTTVPKQLPIGTLRTDLLATTPFILPVVPFNQIMVSFCFASETGQLTSSRRPLQGAREHLFESEVLQPPAQTLRVAFATFSERQVCEPGVLA